MKYFRQFPKLTFLVEFLNKLIHIRAYSSIDHYITKWSEVAQSCPTLCDPMDCSLPGSSLHGILQARVLEWVTISFSRGSSQPRDRTLVSCIPGRHFNLWATREVTSRQYLILNYIIGVYHILASQYILYIYIFCIFQLKKLKLKNQ